MTSNRDTIMCLDDQVLVAMDLCDILESHGYSDVHAVHTEAQALRLLDREDVAVGVLDVNLGQGETSFEVARRLKASGGSVIFLTGYDEADLPAEFKGAPVLRKPLEEAKLVDLLADED